MKSNASCKHNVYVALVHHPVVDKNGETIAAAVTSLDLHDIARASRTYAIAGFYVVTPLPDQQELVHKIIDHWMTGTGARYNPDRCEALSLIRLKSTVADVLADIRQNSSEDPCTVVTSAKMTHDDLSYPQLNGLIADGRPIVLMFGTAWGLAPELLEQATYRLAPIQGTGDYNHLAVRSAVAIILDRILAKPACQN